MLRKSKISTLKKKLHKAWSLKVRQADGFKCIWCGKIDKHNHGHHIVSRGVCNMNGRFDPLNGMTLCYRCHIFKILQEPDEYINIRNAYLANKNISYEDLRYMYEPVVKLNLMDYEYLFSKLEVEI